MSTLPDLDEPIAYRYDHEGDHPDGGHCTGLWGNDDVDRWSHILDQQYRAFADLAARARRDRDETESGNAVSRPLLFLAHHVSEVAIKVALVGTQSGSGSRTHNLLVLWQRLVDAGGISRLGAGEVAWCGRFVEQMHALTPDGFDGRYADATVTEDAWCCFNLDQLDARILTLADLMLRTVTET